jgi:hypothetical protein
MLDVFLFLFLGYSATYMFASISPYKYFASSELKQIKDAILTRPNSRKMLMFIKKYTQTVEKNFVKEIKGHQSIYFCF